MSENADVRELTNIEDAVALLDEWIAAYEELRREHMRLLLRCNNLAAALEHARSACEHWEFLAALEPETECPF